MAAAAAAGAAGGSSSPYVGAAMSAGGNLLGGIVSAITSSHQQREAMKYNQAMYSQQRQDELEMWRMNNEYNAPSAQVARLLTAGINPASQFGEGSVVGNSVSAPSAPTPEAYPMQNLSYIGDTFRSTSEALMNAELIKSQINLNNANADGRRTDAEATKAKLQRELDTMDANLANIIAGTKLTETQQLKLAEDVKLARATFDTSVSTAEAKLNQIVANTALSDAQKAKAISDAINSDLLTQQNLKESSARIANLASSTSNLDADTQAKIFYNTQLAPVDKVLKDASARLANLKDGEKYVSDELRKVSLDVANYQKDIVKYTAEHCDEKTALALINLILDSGDGYEIGSLGYRATKSELLHEVEKLKQR